MKLKSIFSSIAAVSVLAMTTLCYANEVNLVNNNKQFRVEESMTISYVVLAQKDIFSPLIPIEFGMTSLKPGNSHSVHFDLHKNKRVWVQPLKLNGKEIPNLKEKCKLIVTPKSPQTGKIGIALTDNGHTLTCEVHGGEQG